MHPITVRGPGSPASDPPSTDWHRIESHLWAQLGSLALRSNDSGLQPTSSLLVAFSGGPDSLALLAAAVRLRDWNGFTLHACHVDHGLDPGSGQRARLAQGLATKLGVPLGRGFHPIRLNAEPTVGHSLEAWAREQRYTALEELAARLDGAWIATAHHADDQAETLILRLMFGTGLRGMGGIRARRGRLLRPFLELRRRELGDYLAELGLEPILDPTNEDLKIPRNQIRKRVLNEWMKEEPALVQQLGRVASTADRVIASTEKRLADLVAVRPLAVGSGAQLDRQALNGLPKTLQVHVLNALDRAAGRVYPSPKTARSELFEQLKKRTGVVSCDAGSGWRWYSDRQTLRLLGPSTQPLVDFTYTLRAPGSIDLVEIGLRATITWGPPAPWMFESSDSRTAFSLEQVEMQSKGAGTSGPELQIRNRRAGDRIRPFGSRRSKKLKDLMIDRRIPRESRDRLPVLVASDRPIWVCGVTLDDRCRVEERASNVWIIELQALSKNTPGEARPVVEPALNIFPSVTLAADREKGS